MWGTHRSQTVEPHVERAQDRGTRDISATDFPRDVDRALGVAVPGSRFCPAGAMVWGLFLSFQGFLTSLRGAASPPRVRAAVCEPTPLLLIT